MSKAASRAILSDDGLHAAFGGPDPAKPGEAPVRAWLIGPPQAGTGLAALLPLDNAFPTRLRAAHRLWRALNGRAPGRAPDLDTPQKRQRLALVLRALDARLDGASYRVIAAALFGPDRVPADAGWRSHDLRGRTIRMVKGGFALMRGGYVKLLDRRPRS